jgi:hypothetical protein
MGILYFIKKQLGVGNINIETKTKMVSFLIRDRNKLEEFIFPIFDKYPLLTSKYFNYLKFKEAYKILTNINLTKIQRDELIFNLIANKIPLNYISPAWQKVNNNITSTNEANLVMSKAWLIGFTEAEGSFYLVNKSKDRIVHGFEITQKLDLIVLSAIGYILGIKTTSKKLYHTVVTTNSRSIENIIQYYKNTMKGMKSFEFRVWARCYVKHKGNFIKLNEIRNKIRSKKTGLTILSPNMYSRVTNINNFKESNIQKTRLFHTSSINLQNNNLSLILDNSNSKSIINRENGIYKIYDNLFLNAGLTTNIHDPNDHQEKIDKFILDVANIFEDLYDNNESTIFHLYFLVKPDFNRFIKFDVVNLNKHFAKYPLEFIAENITLFYKNTGLLGLFGIVLVFSLYDINNLIKISSGIKDQIYKHIDKINENVHKNLGNTIINYTNKFDTNSEIMLIIHADFEKIEPIKK